MEKIQIKETKKKIIHKGKYLNNKGKYQKQYDDYNKDAEELGLSMIRDEEYIENSFRFANFIYKEHAKANINFKSILTIIDTHHINNNQCLDYLRNLNPVTDEDYENMMDITIERYMDYQDYLEEKRFEKMGEQQLKDLLLYPSHKYYDVYMNKNLYDHLTTLIAEYGGNSDAYLIELNFIAFIDENIMNVKPGDIIGIRTENSNIKDLPSRLMWTYLKKGVPKFWIRRYEEEQIDEFKKSGKYKLPTEMNYINRGEIENIYHFPFVKNLDKLI